MDTDKNGTISFDEFAAWWRSGRKGLSVNFGKALQKRSERAVQGLEKILGVAKAPDTKETVSHVINFKSGAGFQEGRASMRVNVKVGDLSTFARNSLEGFSPPNQNIYFTVGFKPKTGVDGQALLARTQKTLGRLQKALN
jgi:hypothetical protein